MPETIRGNSGKRPALCSAARCRRGSVRTSMATMVRFDPRRSATAAKRRPISGGSFTEIRGISSANVWLPRYSKCSSGLFVGSGPCLVSAGSSCGGSEVVADSGAVLVGTPELAPPSPSGIGEAVDMRPRIAKASASGPSGSTFGTGACLIGTGGICEGSATGRVGRRTDMGGLAAIGPARTPSYRLSAKELIMKHSNCVTSLSVGLAGFLQFGYG